MEDMVTEAFWRGRKVLITGHTGFKGSWLALWLSRMGADVTGYALPAPSQSLFKQARVAELIDHIEGDIRDLSAVEATMDASRPEVVFHLAAQPLVRLSYASPAETFETNVQGTVHVLDACRRAEGLRAIVCVTSDKCYANFETQKSYDEEDAMGGDDPYSASKGAAELVIAAYRRSYFSAPGQPRLASARAGNVIGGGDWAVDRLVPDLIRALASGKRPQLRAPESVRPWQYVLDALNGYLILAEHLVRGCDGADAGWNFGPPEGEALSVQWVAQHLTEHWGAPGWSPCDGEHPKEAKVLRLNSAKANRRLGWRPVLSAENAVTHIAAWHREFADGADARVISIAQLNSYRAALTAGLPKLR